VKWPALLLLAAALAGCGARSYLAPCRRDADCDDGVPCTDDACGRQGCVFTPIDARCDDGVECSLDACTLDGCVHVPDDALCDDGVDCTADACEADGCTFTPEDDACDDGVDCTVDTCSLQGCLVEPDDALCEPTPSCDTVVCDSAAGCQILSGEDPCDDGLDCTFDVCDTTLRQCRHEPCDSLCQNTVFCDGVERCDTAVGCVAGPPACDLGLACSADTCVETGAQCEHVAADGCFPPVRLLVTDADGALLSVSPYGGPAELIAPPFLKIHYDIAVLGDRWFALDTNPPQLVELTPFTQEVKVTFDVPESNALGAGPDGKLYSAAHSVFRIDPDTGDWSIVADLPSGYVSSGDIAFVGERMFVSAGGPCGEMLIEVDATTGAATPIGGNGLACVYGLAVSGGTLFLLDCSGKIGTFDPDTGEAHVLSTPDITVFGADILPR
jgi:hypothetical protein